MFTKVSLKLTKWQLVLAALGQQVTVKVCFGKAVEVRERAERETHPQDIGPWRGPKLGCAGER